MATLISVSIDPLRNDDEKLLRFVNSDGITLDELLSNFGEDEAAMLNSVQRLIHVGILSLVIADYPWEVQYKLQRMKKAF